MGATYCPPPTDTTVVLEKSADIFEYHFKDTDYDCTSCHASYGENNCFNTKGMESTGCYKCHERLDKTEWVHGPVGIGQCSPCHDPHGSKKRMFLLRKGDALCTYCHEEDGIKEHAETVNSNNCTSCHNPHGGANTAMLKD
jgi:predicted CXXCH cytochrome family protein